MGVIALGLILVVGFYFLADYLEFSSSDLTGSIAQTVPIEQELTEAGELQVYFCPHENCDGNLTAFLASAKEYVHCAMFEIDLPSIQQILLEKSSKIEVRIVTDNDYLDEFDHNFVRTDSWGLMHNKFCIVDGKKVSTGSMNPTVNCAHKNNNNLVLIDSKLVAQNYEAEFQELWNGTFKKGAKIINPEIELESMTAGIIGLEMYFCPEDHCAEEVKAELQKAQDEIKFMTFSFTHDGIANVLLLKSLENVSVQGVMEARQVTKYSKFQVLDYQGIDVLKDANPQNLHHKVFIIDGKTVVTGSFNPSAGGDERNDENVLIIHNEQIAQEYLREFESVYGLAREKSQNETIKS